MEKSKNTIMYNENFSKSSPESAAQFQSNVIRIILGLREFMPEPVQRGDNHKNANVE
jgi:hypothetical protein